MKNIANSLALAATLALLAATALASGPTSATMTLQDPCSVEGKTALYGEFYKEIKGDQAKAYEAAKKYVACPAGEAADAAEVQRVTYIKNFIAKYEKADRSTRFNKALVDKKYSDAFAIGKQILSDEPENLRVLFDLTNAGYAASDASLDADTVTFAKKSVQLVESGKAPDKWAPFDSKDDALGWLNYIVATRVVKNSPGEAIPLFIKAASYEGKIKKLPYAYNALGEAYEKGPFPKLLADYKKYEGQEESTASKLALENLNQVIDRMIDAYARAVALSGSDAQYKDIKAQALGGVTDWYKFRHEKQTTGLDELIATVLSKPLPPEPTPITTLPTPAATPASGSGTSAAGSATSSPVKAPGTAKP